MWQGVKIWDNRLKRYILENIETTQKTQLYSYSKNYKDQLKTNNWIMKRREILTRDNDKCINCNNNKYLQIHHLLYFNGFLAWEYENKYLVTLCKKCHETEHNLHGVNNYERFKYYQKFIN